MIGFGIGCCGSGGGGGVGIGQIGLNIRNRLAKKEMGKCLGNMDECGRNKINNGWTYGISSEVVPDWLNGTYLVLFVIRKTLLDLQRLIVLGLILFVRLHDLVLRQLMSSQQISFREIFRTSRTLPWGSHLRAVRLLFVAHEIRHLIEALRTQITPIRTLVAVDVNVVPEIALLVKSLLADVALEILDLRMDFPV